MLRHPPVSPPTDTLFPLTTFVRSRLTQVLHGRCGVGDQLFHVAAVLRDGGGQGSQVADELLDVAQVAVAEQRLCSQQQQVDVLQHFRRPRSEEHTPELQSLMRTSYAVFCLKKTKKINIQIQQ